MCVFYKYIFWFYWREHAIPFLFASFFRYCLQIEVDAFYGIICSALGTWVFSVAGALIAIPVGIKRKSLGPLVFFGTTGTMLDIIMGINECEREHAERQRKLLEAQNSAVDTSFAETGDKS